MLFKSDHRNASDAQRHRYAIYEIVYTLIDFMAAICFVVGSILFFFDSWQRVGTWFFLVGSIAFAAKPALRVFREMRLAAMGDEKDLADRFKK